MPCNVPSFSLRSDSEIHFAISAKPMTRKTRPDGTHMITPPNCWSSSGVSPHRPVVPAYAGYHSTEENVSSAPSALQCTPVPKTYIVAAP